MSHDGQGIDGGAQRSEHDDMAQEEERRQEQEYPAGKVGGGRALANEKNARLLGWVTLPVVALEHDPLSTSPLQEGRRKACSRKHEHASGAARGCCDEVLLTTRGDCAEVRVDSDIARYGGDDEHAARVTNGREAGAMDNHGVSTQDSREDRTATASKPGLGIEGGFREGSGASEGIRQGISMIQAERGSVWFHIPSATFAKELPEDWVAFAGVSGGILADVSPIRLRLMFRQ